MALNLKNPEAEHLSRAVAERTGESLTTAVIVALRERLDRLVADTPESTAGEARLWAIARDIAPALAASPVSIESLYDENGMPA